MHERLAAPAKINLHLHILGLNAQGYHLLDTSFAFVDLCDWLEVNVSDDLSVTCSQAELSGKANLVYQVLEALQQKHGVKQGLSVHIEKHIPMQAGLGGGSSDAATALLAANKFWQLHLSRQELIDFSAPFGADIPCFLFAHPSRATGVGEKLEKRQESLKNKEILLAKPAKGLSTQAVFAHFDQQQGLTNKNCIVKVRAPESNCNYLGDNDLQNSACCLCSELEMLLFNMKQCCQHSWMSGSGSACVSMFDSKEKDVLVRSLSCMPSIWFNETKILECHPLINY
ncbi:MAG: 4-(cytidine 5'-diphospho)-2-C-methyl-D-erythritol kinase [Mariprofundaceae bacterium]|nr:4-(cytidine 5'-diphospho)-2-C-methyl-D-erythritol kinase [Mariprofundaceae bacterium]